MEKLDRNIYVQPRPENLTKSRIYGLLGVVFMRLLVIAGQIKYMKNFVIY